MTVTTTTHLNFRGQAREALEFYAGVLGGTPTVVTYGQAHDPQGQPDHVVWGEVQAPGGAHVMAYDVQTDRSSTPVSTPSTSRCAARRRRRSRGPTRGWSRALGTCAHRWGRRPSRPSTGC